MERIVLEQQFFLDTAVVTPDNNTLQILSSDPELLLKKMFENNPDQVFLLSGSGFRMDRQLLRWINKYRENLGKSGIDQVKREIVEETVQDVIGFYYEYLTGQNIFKIDVEFRVDQEGKKDVYASKYNSTLREINKNLSVITGTTEREGALENGVNTAIDILIDSGPDTVVILNSPRGWSGLRYNGQTIEYPDNQTYVYWIKNEGGLDAITIRTDIDLEAAEKLVNAVDDRSLSEKERIKRVVNSPKRILNITYEDVLTLIENVSGRSFSDTRHEIQNRDSLFKLNDKALELVNSLRERLMTNITDLNEESIYFFAKEVGKTIMDLRKDVLDRKDLATHQNSVVVYDSSQGVGVQLDIYYMLAQDIKTLRGCNGGGMESYGLTHDHMGPLRFKCQNGHENTRPFGQLLPACKVCGVKMCA